MKEINTENFYLLKARNLVAVFVNTLQKAYKSIPNNHYKYTKIGDEFSFQRLYTKLYKYKNYTIYSILEWQFINIKPNCVQAMINYIDGVKTLKEFIEEDVKL